MCKHPPFNIPHPLWPGSLHHPTHALIESEVVVLLYFHFEGGRLLVGRCVGEGELQGLVPDLCGRRRDRGRALCSLHVALNITM